MYKRSIAQLRFMTADSTHVHYLKGTDKKMWESYQEYLKAQSKTQSAVKRFDKPQPLKLDFTQPMLVENDPASEQ